MIAEPKLAMSTQLWAVIDFCIYFTSLFGRVSDTLLYPYKITDFAVLGYASSVDKL